METNSLDLENKENQKIDILDFNKKVGFIMIPNVLFANLTKLNIKPYEYLLLSSLYYFAHQNDSAWPSRKTLEKLTGISQRAIVSLFNSLIKKGYITKINRRNKEKGDISNLYSFKPLNTILERIMTEGLIESQKNNTPVQEMHPPCENDALPPVQEMHPKNIYIEENIIKNNKLEENNTIVPNDFSYEKSNSKQKYKINFNFKSLSWENITEKDIAIWDEAYPAVDIKQELLKMKAWLVSNPEKRKKNYKRFINYWLTKVQDKGGNKKVVDKGFEESGKYKNIKTTHIDNVTGEIWVTGD